MKFEIGKYYKHTTGHCLSIVCEAETTMHGVTLIAEYAGAHGHLNYIAVGRDEDSAVNYREIAKKEWLSNFS